MAPFDRSHTSSYSPSIVTMAISCIVCEIQRLIGKKMQNFYTPPIFSSHTAGEPVGILWRCLMLVRMIALPYSEKNYDDMLSHFHLIPERYGQTDGQTDRIAISVSCISKLTCDKNHANKTNICKHTLAVMVSCCASSSSNFFSLVSAVTFSSWSFCRACSSCSSLQYHIYWYAKFT